MLLSLAERRLGVAERLAQRFPDRRDPLRIAHTLADMIRARIFAIACGRLPESGVEVGAHLRRLVRHVRKQWPKTHVTFWGDSHYARPEAMDWCEKNGVDYVFGLADTKPLSKTAYDKADAVRTQRAEENSDVVRNYAETRHKTGSWNRERRAVARIEATRLDQMDL